VENSTANMVPTPVGLYIGLALSVLSLGTCSLILLSALLGVGHLRIGAEQVSSVEFLRRAGSLVVIQLALLTPIVVGITRRKPWSRSFMMFYWLGIGAWSIGQTIGRTAPGCSCNISWLVALPIAYWYLYKKPNVEAYYKSLRSVA
jgi:hypothetical protein